MKRIWTLLLLLLVLKLVAAELIIAENPVDLEIKKNDKSNFYIELTNTFDFKLEQFQFPNLTGFEFPEFEIDVGETKEIEYSVLREEAGEFELKSRITFIYLVDLPEGIQTHFVNISDQGFDPDYLTIRDGDTVKWTNINNVIHTVTTGAFELELQPNATVQRTFNTVEEVQYHDETMFFSGALNVINASSQEEVHNPEYDKTWIINLDVILDPTGLEFILEESNFSLSVNDSVEGILQIKNFGNKTAEKIHLSSDPDWLVFDENDFNINAGDTNYITFNIEPAIFITEETNKTYNLSLFIDGLNTEKYVKTLNIYVQYENVFDQMESDQGIINLFERWCRSNPNSLFCNRSVMTCPEPEIVYLEHQIPVNYTQKEVKEMLKRIAIMADATQRGINEQKKTNQILNDKIPQMESNINKSLDLQQENEKKQKTRTNTVWIIGFFILLMLCGLAIGFTIRRVRQGKKLQSGSYEGRY